MSKIREYYDECERLYVREGKTQREIAELFNISEKTISKWSRMGEWARKRKEYLTSSRTGVAEKLRERLYRLIEEEAIDARKADEIYKLMLTIEKIQGFDLMAATIEVMDRFSRFVRGRVQDRGFLDKLSDLMQAFFNEIKSIS